MSLTMEPSDEAAVQVLAEAGYSEVDVLARRRTWIGKQDAWVVTATAQGRDGKRYEVDIPLVQSFGGWQGVINLMRTREIN